MATQHNARRRQRTTRRTTTSAAHARAHRVTNARQERAPVPGGVVTAPNSPAPVKTARAVRAPDSDDHLAAYFRQLAEHELLSPEDERELSQGIEDTEILTWERVLSRAEAVGPLLALVEPNLEQPVKFPKLQKIADDMLKTKRGRKDDK